MFDYVKLYKTLFGKNQTKENKIKTIRSMSGTLMVSAMLNGDLTRDRSKDSTIDEKPYKLVFIKSVGGEVEIARYLTKEQADEVTQLIKESA